MHVRWCIPRGSLERVVRSWDTSRRGTDIVNGCNLVRSLFISGDRRLQQLAMLAAMRRTSSWVSSFGRRTLALLPLDIDVSEHLPISIADDEAGSGFLDRPGRAGSGRTSAPNPN
jgi:hypothetical protein